MVVKFVMSENRQIIEAFSWSIDEVKYASKIIDKSVIKYRETVIPIDIRSFFEIKDYSYGDVVPIILFYKGIQYDSTIYFENHNNRSKLKLSKDLHERIMNDILMCFQLNDCVSEKIKILFIREEKNRYKINLIKEL